MKYRHQFHAGNFADVFKHALLVPLVRGMQRKDKPFLYLDTHAGRGSYELERTMLLADGRERAAEWPDGIGRIWTNPPAALADYVELVRSFDRARGGKGDEPQHFPGSPQVVAALARPVDRLALCELREDDGEALRMEFLFRPGVVVQEIDGYAAIRAMLPPPEKRALVLIDPPFESGTEFADVANALAEGLRRLPAGVFAVWYPITDRAGFADFARDFTAVRRPPTLVAEFRISGEASTLRLKGCGLMVVNPPWQIEAVLQPVLQALVAALGHDSGAAGEIRWLVPET